MSISKKLRFEVFKRDNFICQYCGNHPPKIILECDHIIPISKGGLNDINNLITSCFDCNRGKSNIELDNIPNTLENNKNLVIEKENQYLAYKKELSKVDKRIKKEIIQIDIIFREAYENYSISKRFKETTIKMFIEKLGFHEVYYAMNKACSYIDNPEDCLSYFCGICWNIIKNS